MRLSALIRECRRRLAVEIHERRRWRRARGAKPGIRVFYGFDKLGGPGERAAGGIIKTQDLQQPYPNSPADPNLLYLVSSSLPPYALRMAQLAKANGAKVVLNQNGVAYPAWSEGGWQETNRVLGEVLGAADYVFYQSHFCKEGADRFLGPPLCPWEVLHNPVDTERFVPLHPRPDGLRRTLLLAGTHGQFYRVRCALETAAILRAQGLDVRLIVAGRYRWRADEPSAAQEVRDLVRRLGLESAVEFAGPYSQQEAVALFRRAGVLLHTQYNDSCPRLVVEAMACGLPVAYSASGGVPELVGEDAGIGVPAPRDWEQIHAPDPEQLAEGVRRILARYDDCSRAARQRAATRFDVKPWLARHRAVFVRLTEGGALESQ